MFNAINALSEDTSLFSIGLLGNPWLLLAIAGSMALHCVILYIPFFERIFNTVPLSVNDWKLVIAFSAPVIVLDEVLKAVARWRNSLARQNKLK